MAVSDSASAVGGAQVGFWWVVIKLGGVVVDGGGMTRKMVMLAVLFYLWLC